jgi:hypothetical protein
MSLLRSICCFAIAWHTATGIANAQFRSQEISKQLTIGYATRLVDMNGDQRIDIVVVDTDRVVWFENPTWQMHTIIEHATKTDNVCIAPADIDGDGKLDFALGADWHPGNTRESGTIQWLANPGAADTTWTVFPIGVEPTTHRMNWVDLDGDGRNELVVLPLQGAGSKGPTFAETAVRMLAYKIPRDPRADAWRPEVINEDLHVAHNFCATDLDGDGAVDLLVVSFEGVSWLQRQSDGTWRRTLIGAGNQATSPNRGASEIKRGRLASGQDYIATIEPWHGFQVVVYTRPATPGLWERHVIDDELLWGHAVWTVDLDGDRDEELVIGVRDTKNAERPCGVRIYKANDGAGREWSRTLVDPSGVAVEDLAAADLNADGKPDIVAVGRATKNVRIYWNESPSQKTAP